MPAISVIMPVFNRAASVGQAIDSVLGQSFGDFELIVVDDGSSDGTTAAVEAVTDKRVRLVRLPSNRGGNAARNRGIDEARAPLLAFLDSDDLYLPDKLGFTVRYFEANPEIDVLIDSFVKRYATGRERPDVALRNPVLRSNAEIVEALYLRRIWKATPGIAVRTKTAIAAGKFDEELKRRQDFDFLLRLAKVGRCASTDETLWVKTNTSDAISADLRSFAGSAIAFYRRHPEYYSDPRYRRGFALDVGRHFSRLVKRGQLGGAARDATIFAREVGPFKFLGLLSAGIVPSLKRRRRIRTLGRQPGGNGPEAA
jgi:glycosyltransferase involved in cell wall biosynthesis